MSKGIVHYIAGGDSGADGAFAAVNVEFPAGSACQCSNGAETLEAESALGYWTFFLPAAGTWTVSCTDGTEEASQTVSITEDGQSKSVTLSYWNGELYDNGKDFPDITGGWTPRVYSGAYGVYEPTVGETFITVGSDYGHNCAYTTVNPIDLTDITTLYVNATDGAFASNRVTLGVASSSTGTVESSKVAGSNIVSTGITSLDVSSLTGAYYVYVHASGGQSVTFNKVWMREAKHIELIHQEFKVWARDADPAGEVLLHLPSAAEPYLKTTSNYVNGQAQGTIKISTVNPVDLTDIQTVKVNVVSAKLATNATYLPKVEIVAPDKITELFGRETLVDITNGTFPKITSIDVSTFTGEYYIAIRNGGAYNSGGTQTIEIDSIMLD